MQILIGITIKRCRAARAAKQQHELMQRGEFENLNLINHVREKKTHQETPLAIQCNVLRNIVLSLF